LIPSGLMNTLKTSLTRRIGNFEREFNEFIGSSLHMSEALQNDT
jgi:hypothetical protein